MKQLALVLMLVLGFVSPTLSDVTPDQFEINPVCMDRDNPTWYYDEDTKVLCITGKITYDFMYAFEEDMVPRDVSMVVLNSIGGTVDGAVMVSRLIRERGIPTFVPPNAVCYSSCVLVFASGTQRYTTQSDMGSKFKVHFVWNPWEPAEVEGEQLPNLENKIEIHFDKTLEYFDLISEYSGTPDMTPWYLNTVTSKGLLPLGHLMNFQLGTNTIIIDRYIEGGIAFSNAAFVDLDEGNFGETGFATIVDPSTVQLSATHQPN